MKKLIKHLKENYQKWTTVVIVFAEENFIGKYTKEQRSFKVFSNEEYFKSNNGGSLSLYPLTDENNAFGIYGSVPYKILTKYVEKFCKEDLKIENWYITENQGYKLDDTVQTKIGVFGGEKRRFERLEFYKNKFKVVNLNFNSIKVISTETNINYYFDYKDIELYIKSFTKNDLKNGYVVRLKNNELYMISTVLCEGEKETMILTPQNTKLCYLSLNLYTNELNTATGYSESEEIKEIYSYPSNCCYTLEITPTHRKLLWKRG